MIHRPGLRRHQIKSQLIISCGGHMKVCRPKITYNRRCIAAIVQSADRVTINHTKTAINSFRECAHRTATFLKSNPCNATGN